MSVHPSSAATYPWEIEHERVGININIISTSDANRKYSHSSGNRIMYLRENEYPKNTCIYNGGDGGGSQKMATDDKDRVAQGTVLIPPGLRLCPSSACFFWACCRGGRRRGVDAEMPRRASVPLETAEGGGGGGGVWGWGGAREQMRKAGGGGGAGGL